ncbi:sulfite exporter TauE/SafE family protein [Thiorhodovibrio winogradskyi]|uniref:sulfite exporter TauE/SafE family protein n=1 Tax=Thiorhodovibrio winogradskyi TaxID=77007 RepID=UPI002E2E5EC4|nr:sulfite exporter TauE/SafE family protein [Thiorhodovibrio winogradskyi]
MWRAAPEPRAAMGQTRSGWLLPATGTGIGAVSAVIGIGGGSMTVPFLARLGLSMRQAVGTSSACGVPIALFGAIGFVWSGLGRDGLPAHSLGFVYYPAVLVLLLGSVPLAPVGAAMAHRLPTRLPRRIFGTLLILISARLLLGQAG